MPSGVWSALILIGGGILMLVFYPIGAAMGLFQLSQLGFGWGTAAPLCLWGMSLAFVATVGGVWTWNVAARSLPVALTAQLIVSETAFGVIGGLIVHARMPTVLEGTGVAILIAGVVLAIRVFHGRRVR